VSRLISEEMLTVPTAEEEEQTHADLQAWQRSTYRISFAL